MRRTPHLALALAIAMAAALLGSVGVPRAAAGCVGPMLARGDTVDDAHPPTHGGAVQSGQQVVVTGVWFRSGCDDAFVAGSACQPPRSLDPESPLADVALTLHQGRGQWVLDTADAAERADRYAIHWRASIPRGVEPGEAQLRAGTASLPITITE
jgi:hypothetical protein